MEDSCPILSFSSTGGNGSVGGGGETRGGGMMSFGRALFNLI